jgi:uncharacterized ferritin-like protein (DUF455 family)
MNASAWFQIQSIREKVQTLELVVTHLLSKTSENSENSEDSGKSGGPEQGFNACPARDIRIVDSILHPPKPKISSREGQGRLLHDLTNIELQAMELAVRTLAEFPEAPPLFREQLAELALDEGRHLTLCLNALDEMEIKWGSWPIHTALWDQTPPRPQTTLVERVFVVHRHMEGSGLDAGDAILKRLTGVGPTVVREPIQTILLEEIQHVRFGTKWFRQLCRADGLNPDGVFGDLFPITLGRASRTEKPAIELRRQAGFNEYELSVINDTMEKNRLNRF